MLRAIIIDDEEPAIETLRVLASRNADQVKIIGSALTPALGIELIEDYKPDLVFLDISMPSMSGFELLEKLRFRDFTLVFTTAHRDYAIKAMKHKAFDYLLKPVDSFDFTDCINRICREREQPTAGQKTILPATIEVQVKDGIIYIKQKEIVRLEASRSYTEFYLDNGARHIASKSLKEFEPRLDPVVFYRCHKSHIINLQKVQKFVNHDGFFALMSDGSMPDISKNNKDEFLELLKRG